MYRVSIEVLKGKGDTDEDDDDEEGKHEGAKC